MSHKNVLNAWRRIMTGLDLRKPARQRLFRRPIMLERLEARWCPAVNVLTYHNDIAGTGLNNNETLLTPANVNVSSFGKLATVGLDGQVYAQPLVDTGIIIASGVNTSNGAAGAHEVVFVATEHDSLYAIDAKQGDGGVVLWKRSFLDITTAGYSGSAPGTNVNSTSINGASATAITTVTRGDVAVNIGTEVGITGTPVIDPASNTIFLDVKTTETIGGATYYVQRLHAINIADGTDRVVPYLIGATTNDNSNTTDIYVYGTGDGAVTDPYNGTGKQVVQFNALREANRPALSFVNNQVYLAWASHGDNGPYHGWVATWTMSSTALTLTGVLCTSPNDGLSGIWQGGGRLAFEADGSAFYFETGNGDGGAPVLNAQGFPINANYNEALVKAVADPTTSRTNQNPNGWGLKVADYFIPYNVAALDGADSDFGSGAPIVLPDSTVISGHPHLILAAGKGGEIYVIDRDNLGHFSPTGDNVLNAIPNGSGQNTPPVQLGGSLSTAAYFNGKVYWSSAYSSPAYSYVINSNGTLTTTSQTAVQMGYAPGSVAVSANGTANGIAWLYDRNANVIHAYDASSFSTELWNSAQHAGGTDNLGAAVEFAVPTIANGEVFAGTSNSLVIYGLNQAAVAAPNAPVLSATAISGSSINLTWTDSTTSPNLATAYSIEESTDGNSFSVVATAPAAATSIAIGGLQTQTAYYFRIRGLNAQGYSNYSNPAQATTSNTLNGLNYVNNAAGLPNVVVSLAYYDNEYGGGFVPNPWQGSPNVSFFGNQTTGIYDGGAIMFKNIGTTNAVLSPGLVVDNFANSASFQLWDSLIGTQTVIAPGQSLILTQTASGNFDTSDTPVGATFANRSLILPHIHFTLNGAPYVLVDTTQVLDDAGWDEGNIQNISESSVWTQNQVIAGGFSGATGLTLNGAAAVTGGNLVLTNGNSNQAGSVFTSNLVDVSGFTSQFTFQTTGTYAYANTGEGFTFTIQGAGPTALGGSGAALGYGASGASVGINNSVAIKFDLNNNNGEGNDSTGLYTNAASPTNVGSIDLSSTGINFHSGDIFRINLAYVGTTLTVVINDLTTNTSSTQNYTINIPGVVGGSTGYVGFTGATGSQEAIQNIISWAYAPTAATSPNAPSGLGATPASATSVYLNWTNNAANQTSFNLDRATDPGFTQNLIAENLPASPNSFTDTYTGLAPGNTYYYRLRAFNAAGNSGYSNVANITIPLAPPKPTNQMVTGVSATEVDISWQDNAGHLADGYHILRSVNHGSFTVVATLPPTSRPVPSTYAWSDTNLTPNTYYEYHIIAYNVSGNNDFAGVNATTLLPPPTLVYSQRANNAATLYYTVPSGATSMNIYRGTASGAETLLASGVTGSSYVDNSVTNGVTYFYYVTAVNANSLPTPNEESAPSNQSSPVISGGTFQWTGNGANANWTTAGNWLGGVAPTGGGSETLVFPNGAARLTNIDDLPVGANAFAGITTAASGYTITVNNPLALGAGGLQLTVAGTQTINAASAAGIFLVGGESFTTATGATLTINSNITEMNGKLTIAGNGNTTLNGSIAGTAGLTATETGTLTLNSASTYTGPTQISAGTVNAYSSTPLGVNSDVTVATGATLDALGTYVVGGGLQGQYYNITPVSANFNSLTALNNSLAGHTPAVTALSSTTSLNNSFDFGTTGSAFPAPYSSTNATNFEAVFTGLFNAQTGGSYNFDTGSDDGSMIFIDGNVVVNNNFVQPVTVRSGTVNLTQGMHSIVIAFYQAGGGYGLYADVQVPNGTLQRIPNALLSGTATNNFQIGSLVGGGTVALGANSLTVGGANHIASFTGTFTGTSETNVIETGTGSQTIGKPNYGGTTTINSGTLQLGDGTHSFSAIPAGTISDNGTLAIAIPTGATLAYSNAISGSGGLTVSGGGTLTLSGANSYTGPTLISGGIVNASNDSALGRNSDVTVATSATLNIPARGSIGLAGAYYSSAPNNAPTYLFADTTTVANYVAGLPVIATDRSSNANSQNNGGTVFDYGSSGQGFPSAVLANPNQFVAVWTGQFLAPTSGVYTFDTGSDDGSMLFIDGNAVVFNNAFQPLTVRSGSVPLTQGSHSIVIAYYQGGGNYGMYADAQVPGGTLQRIPNALLNTYANLQVGSLGGAGNVVIGGSNSLTVGGDNNSSTFSGIFSGSGSLIKNGTATMTLSGASTYTGATAINQGTLVAASNSALGTAAGGTTVANGAALAFSSNVSYTTAEPVSVAGTGPAGNGAIENISGTNSFAGPITLTGSASIGSDAGLLTLGGAISGTGALTFTGSGNLFISGNPPSNIIKNGTGVVTLAASDSAPSTTVNAGTLNCAAIDGKGTTTINSGSSLIANHIVQGSLVIGGIAGSPATVTIAASDANGNPLNAVATSNTSSAIDETPTAPQTAPSTAASGSAVATAFALTSTTASSEPPISVAVALGSHGSSESTLAVNSNSSASTGRIAFQSTSGIVGVSEPLYSASNQSERSVLLTTTGVASASDATTSLERQIADVANGSGVLLQRDAVAAADADVLEWAASTPAARPSAADADISLLPDDLLDSIGRQWQMSGG